VVLTMPCGEIAVSCVSVRVEQLKQAQTISPLLHDSCFATNDISQTNPNETHLNDELGEHQVQLETYRCKTARS